MTPTSDIATHEGFAWTATHETADYKHYPPYANLTGNRLAVRGPEKTDGEHPEPGDYVAVDLPDEALADLRAALESAKPSAATHELVEKVARAISVPEHHTTWDLLTEAQKDLYRSQAHYAILATDEALTEARERIVVLTELFSEVRPVIHTLIEHVKRTKDLTGPGVEDALAEKVALLAKIDQALTGTGKDA